MVLKSKKDLYNSTNEGKIMHRLTVQGLPSFLSRVKVQIRSFRLVQFTNLYLEIN